MYQTILNRARQENKNILIIGSPRSGTHALSAELPISRYLPLLNCYPQLVAALGC